MSTSGIIHLVLVVAGGSRFYWNLSDDELPDWNLPGHPKASLVHYPTDVTRDVLPVAVHSHNDYLRRNPFYDALFWGCTSIETDVWHFAGDDELYVGHNKRSLTESRTFRSLYVDPLVKLLDAMNKPAQLGNAREANATWRGVFDTVPSQTL